MTHGAPRVRMCTLSSRRRHPHAPRLATTTHRDRLPSGVARRSATSADSFIVLDGDRRRAAAAAAARAQGGHGAAFGRSHSRPRFSLDGHEGAARAADVLQLPPSGNSLKSLYADEVWKEVRKDAKR